MTDAVFTTTTNTAPNSNLTAYSSRLGKSWKISTDGLQFMAVLESGVLNGKNFLNLEVTNGFILTAYKDNAGIPTVGCGHRILETDKIAAGQTITMERAQDFLRKDLALMEGRLNRDVRVPLFQFEYDTMVSIIFNCGSVSWSG